MATLRLKSEITAIKMSLEGPLPQLFAVGPYILWNSPVAVLVECCGQQTHYPGGWSPSASGEVCHSCCCPKSTQGSASTESDHLSQPNEPSDAWTSFSCWRLNGSVCSALGAITQCHYTVKDAGKIQDTNVQSSSFFVSFLFPFYSPCECALHNKKA